MPTPVITAQAISDVTEGGTAGVMRLTRTETVGDLWFNYSTSGTAETSEYGVPNSPMFFNGSATCDLFFTASSDSTSEPTETITLTLASGAGYTVGTPDGATINILDSDTPMVSVEKVADGTEGDSAGTFRFTRLGDLSSALTVNYTVGGTATSATDYTSIGTSVAFAANAATADKTVTVATDAIYDPDETVSVTVTSGTDYTVGSPSSAEVSITDDSSTVQTLIHEQTFQLTGASGNVDVTLTVTYNAPGAEGKYTWSYAVTNPSANSVALTSFSIPIDDMDSDVADLTSSIGWTETIGVDSVSWAAGTGLSPGNSATFSFTTDPREVGPATIEAGGGGGFLADLPTAPAPKQKTSRPLVKVKFFGLPGEVNNYTLALNISAADGTNYTTGNIPFSNVGSKQAARDLLYAFLLNNGWAVEKVGDFELAILGKVEADKSITAIKSLTYSFSNVSTGNGFATVPEFTDVGQVTVGPTP